MTRRKSTLATMATKPSKPSKPTSSRKPSTKAAPIVSRKLRVSDEALRSRAWLEVATSVIEMLATKVGPDLSRLAPSPDDRADAGDELPAVLEAFGKRGTVPDEASAMFVARLCRKRVELARRYCFDPKHGLSFEAERELGQRCTTVVDAIEALEKAFSDAKSAGLPPASLETAEAVLRAVAGLDDGKRARARALVPKLTGKPKGWAPYRIAAETPEFDDLSDRQLAAILVLADPGKDQIGEYSPREAIHAVARRIHKARSDSDRWRIVSKKPPKTRQKRRAPGLIPKRQRLGS